MTDPLKTESDALTSPDKLDSGEKAVRLEDLIRRDDVDAFSEDLKHLGIDLRLET